MRKLAVACESPYPKPNGLSSPIFPDERKWHQVIKIRVADQSIFLVGFQNFTMGNYEYDMDFLIQKMTYLVAYQNRAYKINSEMADSLVNALKLSMSPEIYSLLALQQKEKR
jgi:hypothetical protein